jgi:protoporphyrin/coproporphyrin ferrochelatase
MINIDNTMKRNDHPLILANFGGPRDIHEIYPFLKSLLTDRDVIRTPLPPFLNTLLFTCIAKRRTAKVAKEYMSMGGGSPIFKDTEAVAALLKEKTGRKILTFHRYLPMLHQDFIHEVLKLESEKIDVFPFFPQFTYATTGSIARWFQKNLPMQITNKLRWIKSYPDHPSFIAVHQQKISSFMEQNSLDPQETILFFSAHGIPQKYVNRGDIYRTECMSSFKAIMQAFPKTIGRLCFQSKFGPGEWLKPYTSESCEKILEWNKGRQNVVFIPISFTSDHIETLCEIENDYMTVVREKGLKAFRVPALTADPPWIEAITHILDEKQQSSNMMLIRTY